VDPEIKFHKYLIIHLSGFAWSKLKASSYRGKIEWMFNCHTFYAIPTFKREVTVAANKVTRSCSDFAFSGGEALNLYITKVALTFLQNS